MFERITSLFYLCFCAICTKYPPLFFANLIPTNNYVVNFVWNAPSIFCKISKSEFCIIYPLFFHFSNTIVFFCMNTPCEKAPTVFAVDSFYSTPLIFSEIRNVYWLKLPPLFFSNERAHETSVGLWGIWISMW